MLAGALFILRSKLRRLFRLSSNNENPETEKSAEAEASE